MGIVNYKGYETNEIFDSKQECDDLFWKNHFKEYSINIEPRKFASEVIEMLKKEGNEIYIITARGSFLSHSSNVMSKAENEKIVTEWLNKNKIVYDKIIFSPEDKLDICIKNDIDIMIEDKVNNIKRISSKIPVICFNAGYNEECEGKNIYRVYSWYDIYNTIKNKIDIKEK